MAALPPKPTTRKPKPSILGDQGYTSQTSQQRAQANVPFNETASALSGQKLPPGAPKAITPPGAPNLPRGNVDSGHGRGNLDIGRNPPTDDGGLITMMMQGQQQGQPQPQPPAPTPPAAPPAPSTPSAPPPNPRALQAFQQALAQRPFITGANIDTAMQLYNKYASQGRGNEGDWINWAISDLGWDAGTAEDWAGHQQRHPAAGGAPPAAGGGPRYQGGGVDNTKWNDANHKTAKYQVLRVLDQWDPRVLGTKGLLSLTPEQRKQISDMGFQIVDEDKVYRADVGEIDVLHGDRSEYGWRETGKGNAGGKPKPVPLPKPEPLGPGFRDSGHGNDPFMPDGTPNPNYKKPGSNGGPMIAANGQIPPGIPYNPDLARQGFTAPTPQPMALDNTFQARENELIQQLLNNPMYDQNFQNQLNEQQKELALARGQAGQQQLLQNAASRGVSNGGALQANQNQLHDDTTRQLLQSQRDVSMGVQEANRNSLLDALDMSTTTGYNRNNQNSQLFDNMMQARGFDLDRDLSIEGLNQKQTVSNQWERDFINSQNEFNRNLKWQYDNANLNSQQRLIEWILRGGKL